MRKFKFTLIAFMAAMMALSFTACSDDDPEPNPNPDPEVNEDNYHFDLFVTVDKHGGMSSKNTTIVHSVNSLATEQGVITVKREGSELGDYSMETISKGKYYYQIPATNDRFVKYQIKNNAVQVIAERPFKANSYKVRSYTHAWIDDNTLVIMSTNGKKDKILYTKLNAEDLTILAEGELNIPAPTNWLKLTSSGILTYRKSDNRLYYFYYWKETDGLTNIDQQEPNFHTAIINPSTMEVEKDVLSPIECEMAGSAYGELMQNCVMYDEADNLYLACFHEEDNAFFKGILLRINKGETEFDASYNGYPNADGKLLTIQYLEGNKALVLSLIHI